MENGGTCHAVVNGSQRQTQLSDWTTSTTILIGVRWDFDLHFMMLSNINPLFKYLLTIYMSSLGKCVFSNSIHFKKICYWVICVTYIFCISVYIRCAIFKIFSNFVHYLSFCKSFILLCRSFWAWYSPIFWLAFVPCIVGVISQNLVPISLSRNFPSCLIIGVLWFQVFLCLSF